MLAFLQSRPALTSGHGRFRGRLGWVCWDEAEGRVGRHNFAPDSTARMGSLRSPPTAYRLHLLESERLLDVNVALVWNAEAQEDGLCPQQPIVACGPPWHQPTKTETTQDHLRTHHDSGWWNTLPLILLPLPHRLSLSCLAHHHRQPTSASSVQKAVELPGRGWRKNDGVEEEKYLYSYPEPEPADPSTFEDWKVDASTFETFGKWNPETSSSSHPRPDLPSFKYRISGCSADVNLDASKRSGAALEPTSTSWEAQRQHADFANA